MPAYREQRRVVGFRSVGICPICARRIPLPAKDHESGSTVPFIEHFKTEHPHWDAAGGLPYIEVDTVPIIQSQMVPVGAGFQR